MADKTVVGERGQTAIPARLRRDHRVAPGTRLVWESAGPDEWRVHIERDEPRAGNPTDMLGFAKRFRRAKRTADWMRELREGER